MGLIDRAIVHMLPLVPRRVVRRVSSRYIAGSTLDDARRAIVELNAQGKMATVDVLGEEVASPTAAEAIARQYHAALEAIRSDHLDANVSVKLTALGLEIDLDLCRSLLAKVVADAGGSSRCHPERSWGAGAAASPSALGKPHLAPRVPSFGPTLQRRA